MADVQSFTVDAPPAEALRGARAYLEGAGRMLPRLRGELVQDGDTLLIHHGRLRTRIEAVAEGPGSGVVVERTGHPPLHEQRGWLVALGLLGTIFAWALAVYNDTATRPVSPVVLLGAFFAGLVAMVAVVYVVDRCVERRVGHLLMSLEEAMRRDAHDVLEREMRSLDRAQAVTHGVLFLCAAIVVEFLVFVILLSEGVRQGIDEATTVAVMRQGFLVPVVPAMLYAGCVYAVSRRLRHRRLGTSRTAA